MSTVTFDIEWVHNACWLPVHGARFDRLSLALVALNSMRDTDDVMGTTHLYRVVRVTRDAVELAGVSS